MLNVGIVGLGYIGEKRAKTISNYPNTNLQIVCDNNIKKAHLLSKRYDCRFTGEWKKVVNDCAINIVVVSTTNDKLAQISIGALNNKKHVLCEKPMGRNIKEAYQIYQAAVKNRVKLKTGFNLRFHPAISKAFSMCQEGGIGRILFIRAIYGHGARLAYDKEWRMNLKVSGGGELIDQGVHIIDLFRWFMGEFKEVFAVNENMFWKKSPCEDNSFVLMRTGDGRVASAQLSITQWKNRFSFEIFGEKGYLIIDGLGKSYGSERLIYGRRKRLGQRPIEKIFEFPDDDISWRLEWKEFINSIKEGRESLGSGFDGLKTSQILSALYDSAKKKKMIRIGGA